MTGQTQTNAENRAPLVVMAKPVGSACNMRCAYCYYLHTTGSSPIGKMSHETLEMFIRNYIRAAKGPVVSFTWHGGEPMLAGLDFYRDAAALQKKYLPDGWECWNSLQTNGLMLDEAWCGFLQKEHFDVGVSLDGTAAIHDTFRADTAGQKTYARIAENIRLLRRHGIEPDLLCTVTAMTAQNGVSVYQTLRDLGTGWIQFIPIVCRDDKGQVTPESVSPQQYGEFLKDVFSQWVFHDLDKTEVQLFSEMALVLSGQEANLCWMRKTCGHVPVIEKDGGVYACDHFVRPEYRIGSVLTDDLNALMESPRQKEFGLAKTDGLTAYCRACPYLALCNGGCLKDRFARSPDGEEGQYYLCDGLKSFFAYAVPLLREAMRLSAQGKGRQEIMDALVKAERARCRGVSRNDPCPCGSGRKFKLCCLRRCP